MCRRPISDPRPARRALRLLPRFCRADPPRLRRVPKRSLNTLTEQASSRSQTGSRGSVRPFFGICPSIGQSGRKCLKYVQNNQRVGKVRNRMKNILKHPARPHQCAVRTGKPGSPPCFRPSTRPASASRESSSHVSGRPVVSFGHERPGSAPGCSTAVRPSGTDSARRRRERPFFIRSAVTSSHARPRSTHSLRCAGS
jgi:hypothetical protein